MGDPLMAALGHRIMFDQEIKQQVQDFYNQVGWQEVSAGVYQNARYEDLRPVTSEYIHRCHLRVLRHLNPRGRLLLDAGSGPIQYPEYLEYSKGYAYRVCADISIVALHEARKRIGEHGLFVVCDIANLPFKPDIFEGAVSLHAIHHLPVNEQVAAYTEINRVIYPEGSAVVVNGWSTSQMMERWELVVKVFERCFNWVGRMRKGRTDSIKRVKGGKKKGKVLSTSTFTERIDHRSLSRSLKGLDFDFYVWRSVNVRFLRTLIHPFAGGKYWLRLLYWLEERNPIYFGMVGQYPMVVIHKKNRSLPKNGKI
jgi:ubiquinone/menaquinone biosynthesis C-methylase UbiE